MRLSYAQFDCEPDQWFAANRGCAACQVWNKTDLPLNASTLVEANNASEQLGTDANESVELDADIWKWKLVLSSD